MEQTGWINCIWKRPILERENRAARLDGLQMGKADAGKGREK